MIKVDNFISFSIVNGFFIGLIVAVIKFDEAEMIAIFTFFVTLGFYLIFLTASALYIRYLNRAKTSINRDRHDGTLEFFTKEFDKRESVANKIREFMREIEKNRDNTEEVTTTTKAGALKQNA